MAAVLALIGIILLALAGLGVAAPRFQPGWLGLGFCAAAFFWSALTGIGG